MSDATADRAWPGLVMPAQKPEWNAWPDVACGREPVTHWIIFQYRLAATRTKSGLFLGDETVESDQFSTTAARIVAIGPTAFRDQFSGADLAGAPWFKVGDFVTVPLTGLYQYKVDTPHGAVRFGMCKDEHIKCIDLTEAAEYAERWEGKK